MSDPDEFYVPDDGDPWQQQMEELEAQWRTQTEFSKPEDERPASGNVRDQKRYHTNGNPF